MHHTDSFPSSQL